MCEKTYYVHRAINGLIEMRQVRFREKFKTGIDHPHDVCAVARSVEELRNMLVSVKINPDSVDWSE